MAFNRRIGFHVKSLEDFKRFLVFEGVNLVEIKPQFWKRNNNEIYSYKNGLFRINKKMASSIKEVAEDRNIQIQLHLPFTKKNDINDEEGLCQGIKEHHGKLLDRYKMLAELYDKYNIGKVITVHPPTYIRNKKQVCTITQALEYGRELYFALDNLIKDNNYKFKIGIENLADPKKDSADLGYEVFHLKKLLGETEEIGLTVDTGHRLLAEHMSVKEMFALAPIVNMHFHSNPGVFSDKNYDDDKHELAKQANLKNFGNYIKYIRRCKIPVVCEISDLDKVHDSVLSEYVKDLRIRLE